MKRLVYVFGPFLIWQGCANDEFVSSPHQSGLTDSADEGEGEGEEVSNNTSALCVRPAGDCKFPTDCCAGLTCVLGHCVGPGGVAEGEAEAEAEGEGEASCPITDPDLSGGWQMESTYHLDEAVNGLLDFVLEGADDLHGFICPVAPLWACQLLGTIIDINDILSTLLVKQYVTLSALGGQSYDGEEQWTTISIQLGGEWVEGAPQDVYYWEIDVDDFNASVCGGVLTIDDHEASMSFCQFIQWALNVATSVSTEGQYSTFDSALASVCTGLEFPIAGACEALAYGLISDLIGCGGIDILTFDYGGTAVISGPTSLTSGDWEGELSIGDQFTGEFSASKE